LQAKNVIEHALRMENLREDANALVAPPVTKRRAMTPCAAHQVPACEVCLTDEMPAAPVTSDADYWIDQRQAAYAVTSDALPPIEVGDVVITDRGRRLIVGEIEVRPEYVPAEQWQGAERKYIDKETGSFVLGVAVVDVYRRVWTRGGAK
jgi:hypothetical protein